MPTLVAPGGSTRGTEIPTNCSTSFELTFRFEQKSVFFRATLSSSLGLANAFVVMTKDINGVAIHTMRINIEPPVAPQLTVTIFACSIESIASIEITHCRG